MEDSCLSGMTVIKFLTNTKLSMQQINCESIINESAQWILHTLSIMIHLTIYDDNIISKFSDIIIVMIYHYIYIYINMSCFTSVYMVFRYDTCVFHIYFPCMYHQIGMNFKKSSTVVSYGNVDQLLNITVASKCIKCSAIEK